MTDQQPVPDEAKLTDEETAPVLDKLGGEDSIHVMGLLDAATKKAVAYIRDTEMAELQRQLADDRTAFVEALQAHGDSASEQVRALVEVMRTVSVDEHKACKFIDERDAPEWLLGVDAAIASAKEAQDNPGAPDLDELHQ